MANFFEQQYKADNPVGAEEQKPPPPTNFFTDQYTTDHPEIKNIQPKKEEDNSYLNSFFQGMAKTNPPVYSTGLGDPEEEAKVFEAQKKQRAMSPEDVNKAAETAFPHAVKEGPIAGALEGAGEAAINPLTYGFGPAGVVSSLAAGATTGWRHSESPDTPGKNALWGLGAGVLAPSVGNAIAKGGRLAGEGLGWIERTPLVQAWLDQGITGVTAAGVGENSMPKTVRAFRESPNSNAIDDIEKLGNEQLQGAVTRQADTLGNATTKQEAGTQLQSEVSRYIDRGKSYISAMNNSLNNAVDPKTTNIDAYPILSRLVDQISPTPGSEAQASQLLPKAQIYIENLMKDIVNRNQIPGNNDKLPLAAIKTVKQAVGDLLDESILNGDVSKRQLKLIYGALGDAERGAYIGTPYEQRFNAMQTHAKNFYDGVEENIGRFVEKGVTPERAAQLTLAGSKVGATQLEHLLQEVPTARGPIASEYFRNLGSNTSREFDPNTFFKNWQRISPEAKEVLYANPITGQMAKDYDQLALLAERQAESHAARNTSGTGGVNEAWKQFREYANAAGTVAGGVLGAGIAHGTGLSGVNQLEAGAAGMLGGSTLARAVLPPIAGAVVPKLLTNPDFVRWLATPKPLGELPASMRALTTIAGEYPELTSAITSFQNYYNLKNGPQQGEKGRGYAEGGTIGPYVSANGNNPGNTSQDTRLWNQGWQQLGVMSPFENNSILDLVMKPTAEPKPPANDFALGGLTDTRQPVMAYAKGGSVDNSNLNDKFSKAIEGLTSLGVDPDVAKGAIKYMYVNESKLDPNIVNPTSGALGIGQMLGPRKQALLAKYGNKPSFDQQMEHILGELQTTEKGTLKALLAASGKGEKPGYDIWGKLFERPGDAALKKAGVNYTSGDIRSSASGGIHDNNNNNSSEDDNSVLEQFLSHDELPGEEDNSSNEETETAPDHSLEVQALEAAPWVSPEVKYAAGHILNG